MALRSGRGEATDGRDAARPDQADIPAWNALLAAIGRSERSGEHYDEADLAEEMDNPDITLGIYRRAGFEVETRWSDYALVEG